MPAFILSLLFTLMMLSSGCNNPSGGSVISRGHTPLLQPPTAFSFSQIRAANGNVSLMWRASKRAGEYKVYYGTSSSNVTTQATACSGLATSCTVTGLDPNTLYYFNVVSINEAGKIDIDYLPAIKSVSSFDITGSTIADGSVTLSWSASTNATRYDIQYGFSPGSYSNTVSNVTSPHTVTGLSNGKTHYFRVLATNSNYGYVLNNTENTETPIGPPDVPTGLSLAAAPGSMTLSWNQVAGANSYKIYKGTTSGSLSLVTSTASNSYFDNSTTDGTTYFYAIKSTNALYDSALSPEVSARSITNFNMSSVTTGSSANQLVVSWPNTTGASTYNIRYGTNSSSLSSTVTGVSSPYTFNGLSGGTTYYFKVVANNSIGTGTSLESLNQLSGTPIPAIAAPTGFIATSTPSQVSLSWNNVSGASSYEVLRGTTSGSYTSLQNNIVGNSYIDSTVTNGTTYFYVVRSFNGLYSPNSTEVSTRPIGTFTISSVTPISSASLQITWGAASGASSYDVRYGTSSGSYTSTITGVSSPYTLTGLAPNTTYYIVINARNAVGTGTTYQSAQSSGQTKTAAPSGLIASTTPSQIALDWSNTTGAASYSIYRGTTSGSYSSLATGLSTSDYIDNTVTDGTTYYYVVTATNSSESAYSAEVAAQSISAFTITSTSSPSPSSITVNWPNTTGAASYDIKYGTSSGSYTTTVTNQTSPATITGLVAGTNYFIRVVAKNAVGTGSSVNSNEVSQGTPVGPPTGVVATVGNSQISLSWNAMSGASSYKVYRGTTSGSYSQIAAGVVPTSYVDSTVVDGTIYYYVIKSFNGADSVDSSEVSGKSISAFSLSSLVATSSTSFDVAFPATTGGDLYDIRYGTSAGSYSTTLSNVTSPISVASLSPNTTYYVVARARNNVGSGASRQTPELSIKTPTATPSSLVAVSSSGQVSLSWGAVTGASSYKVYRGTSSGSYSEIANGVASNSYDDLTVTNGTIYYYVVRAFNGLDSANSNEVSTQPIEAFSIASLSSPSSSSIQVSWNAVAGAATYDVKWGTTSGSYTGSAVGVSSPYTIASLAANTTYYIIVTAKNSVGAGSTTNSSEGSFRTATLAPTSLVASASPGQVGLNWAAPAGAGTYKVYRGTSSGSYTEIASAVASTAYLDTTVTNGTTYFYVVKANNGSDSAYSNEVSIRPISSFTLTAATPTSSSSVDLTWGPATGAAAYDVRYGTSSGVYLMTQSNVTSTYSLTGLTAGTTYYIVIEAKNTIGSGTSVNSNERSFTTAPASPAGLTASSITNQVNLSWNTVAAATNYRVYRGTVSGTYAQIASGVTGTTYSDTTVSNGTTYYYAVRSFNGTESADSNEASALPISAFSISGTTPLSPSSIQVSWGAASGATSYDVEYGTSSGSYSGTVSGVSSPYTITALSSGTTYFIRVVARNAVGAGGVANSPEVSQITPIGPPTGLSASATPSAINLNWAAAGGASSYKVFRGTTSGSYSEIANGVVSTSYADTSAVNGTTYYYVVRSFNGADSANSNEVSSQSISNFSIASTSSPTSTSIQLSWGAATGAATYDVRYGTTTGSYGTTISAVTSPYTITGLNPNTNYFIIVRANNAVGAGASVNTSEVSQRTATSAPVGLTASATPGQVGLNWTATTGATSYKVYRGTTSGSLTLLASGVGSNAYLDTTVVNGTTYYYGVVANNGSDSAQSAEVSVRPIGSFTLTAANSVSSSAIDLTWGAATGAATYDVRYGTSSGVYLGTASSVTSPYTLTGLSANTQYFISIRASNAVGAGTNFDSNERNTTTATAAPATLAATATTGQIDLSWAAASGATNYNIYRGTTSGSYSQIAAGVGALTYTDTTITNGTQYYYVVRSFNGIESANSNEATAQAIASFSIASTTAPTTSTIEVTWPNTSGATVYDVRYGTSTGSYTTTLSAVTSPYTITGLASGTNYFIVVRARNTIGSGSSATSPEVTQITPIGPPTGLSASATPSAINLNWAAAGGASSYKVFRGTTSGSYSEIANGVVSTSYADTSAVNGTTYYYVVRSFNGADSANSNEVSSQSISNFSIASTSSPTSTSIQLSWGAATGAATYDVRYGTSTGSYGTTISAVTSPYTITGLNPNTNYFIIVRANNAVGAGASVNTSEVSQRTATSAPVGLTASATPGQVGLNWTATTGATSYKVYRGTTSGSLTLLASGVGSNAYLDTTVVNGTTYYYGVVANNGSDSAQSAEVSVRPIGSFTLTAANSVSSSAIDLTWGAATGAATYDVRYGTSSGVYLGTASSVTSPYTLTGLSANTQYFISIRASNAVGAGTNFDSNERNTTTATAAPATLAATATTGQIDLSWAAASGATNYNIYRGTTSGSYSQIAAGVGALTYTDTTITNGTQYYYVVRSFNGIESANSNEATAQAIAAFSIASTTAPTTSTIEVTWPNTSGATVYDVRYGTSTGSYTTTLSAVTSPYTITGLTSNTNYFIVVRARNTIGSGSAATTSEVSQMTPLSAPSGLTASATPGSVNLNWTTVTGASSYKIFRGTASGVHSEIASGVATNSYTDNSVTNGTTYFYTVKAFNGADSAKSNEASIRPVASFSITSAIAQNSTTIDLTWPAVAGASSYDIKYGTSSGSYSTTLTGQTSPTSIGSLSPGVTYFFVVVAKNSIGSGTQYQSPEVGAATAFGAPSGLVASATPGQVNLNWNSVSGASSYKVLRGTTSGSHTVIESNALTNSYVDTGVTNGTTYFYVVRAFNGTDSANSNEVSVRPIGVFTLSSATVASSSSINLTWGAATGATTYDVRYGTTSGSYTGTAAGVTSPYTLTGLSAGTTYFVSIRAKNAIGAGTNYDSNELSAKTSPSAPGSLAAAATTGQIALSWSAATGATNYNVYRSTTTTGPYSQIASAIAPTNYTDTTVTNGTQYFYVVRGFNGSESADSNEATAQSIAAFTIASTSAPTTSTIQVTWSNTSGATAYDVRYGTSTGSYSTTVSSVTSPYTITGLTGGTTYYIVVRARNTIGAGSSAQTPEVNQITPLSAPTGLVASSTPGSVSLSWNNVIGATNYKVFRGTTSGSYSSLATGVATNSYVDNTAVNGTTYFYVVKAFNGADSADSNEATTRPMANFSIASTSSPSSTSVQVTWTGPTGAATYDVRYGTATGSYTTTVTSVTSPYTITGLTANTNYYIVVRANNSIGTGTSVTSSESIQKTAPSAPTGLVASATPSSVSLSWSAVTGATDYKIYRGTTSGSLSLLASANVPASYTDNTAVNGTTYFYAVAANNGTDSAQSAEVSVRPIGVFTLSSATVASSSSINLTWGAATGASTYDVRYGTTSGSYTGTAAGVTSPYTLTGLTAGTTYFVSIRAKNAIGAGTNYDSNELSAKTATLAPGSLAAAATTGQIALSWSAATGATNYNVYRSTTTTGPYSQIASAVAPTNYTDTTVTNGTQYFYVVRSFNGSESADSNEATAQSIAAFTIASTSAPTTSTIQVTWSNTSGATAYDVRYGTSTGSYSTTVSSVTSPYTITGLTGATNYFIVVRARNTIGTGSSAQTPEVNQVTPLSAPTGLVASSTPGSVSLSWNNVVGATNYKVFRGTTSGSYSSLATGVATNSYVDNTAVNGTTYFYVVKAFNGADSADSNEATTRPMANFSIASTSSPSSTSVQVTWTGPTGAATYDVRYGTATGSYTSTVTSVTSPYTITGLTANTNYYIVVRANNSIGAGTSVTSSESIQKTAPSAPTGLVASATPSSVSLSWSAVTGATDYKIYRGTTSGSLSLLASANVPASYTDNTAVNGTTYFYAVAANNGTDSAQSAEVSVRPIGVFTLSSATVASSSSINLTWGAATGATTYDVRYGTTSGSYTGTAAGVTSPYTLTGLTAGTTYFVSIRAKNAVGAGTNYDSNELSAKTATLAPGSLAAAATTGQIALSWSAATGATNYNVYRSTTTTGPYSQIASAVAPTNYTDTSVTNGTQYFYVVRSFNGSESADSNEATGQSIAAFTIASTSAPTTSTIQVTWSNTSGATAYDVRYGTSTGSYSTTVSGVTSPYTITGLTGATNYFIVVRARNTIGTGSSAQTPEVNQVTPLGAPTGLVASSTPGSVTLSWNNVSGASSYKVYRGTTSGSYSSLAAGVATNSYVDNTAVNGTTYFYVVKAFNGADSADSNEASILPMANFVISSTTSPSSSTVQVTWTGPTGAATYDVRYGTATGSYSTTMTGVTSPYTITGLSPGTTYYIVVRANNSVGSGSSVTSSESSQLTALGAPTGLIASATPGSVGLNWNSQPAASSFKVYRGTTSGSLSLLASGVATNAYMDNTVSNGVTYFYAVVAYNGSDSAQSSEVSVRPISSFTLTAATATGASTIDLTWGAATGASSYDVRYGTSPGVYLSTVAGVTSPYTLTALSSGTTYYISIQAKNAVGAGTVFNSNERNAKTGLGAPTGLVASSTPGNVSLSWNAVSGATNYNVYRATASGGPYSQIASAVSPTSYNDNAVANGTTYYYVVRTFNGIESVNSSEVFIRPISSFTLASATVTSSTNVNLTWGAATGASTYDVRYGTVSGSYTTTVTSVTSPYSLTGLSPATLYYVAIRANNTIGSGASVTSNELSFTTATGAPASLTAAAITGQVNLSWSAAPGAASYRVYRGTTTTGPYSQIASGIATTNYSDATVVNGTQYFYVVRAFNGTESADSNEATATPIGSFIISSTSAPSSTSIQVNWNAATGATAYDVRFGTSTGNYTTTVSSVTSPYTITGLTANTTYFIIVRARNTVGSGASANSPEVTQITPVAAPTGLVATGGTSQVNLTWTAASGATSYKILRGTAPLTYSEIASGVTGTSYTDNTAVNGTTYYYALKSFNGADSAVSSEVSSRPISSFSISSITGPSSSSITVTWGAASGAASYDLKYGTSSGSYTTTLVGVTSPRTITGLATGTTYYVQIVAKNTVGTGTTVNSAESNGATNSPPVLSTISNQSAESPNAVNAPFTLTDSNDILTCTGAMSGSSSNTVLIPNANITFSGSMPNCSATITPASGQTGTSTITLTASDGKDSTFRTFTVTITPCTVASIVWETQPTNISAGSNWGTAPRVSLRKADNSLCTTNTSPVSLSVTTDNSNQQDASVTGVNPVTPSGGYALFSGATITRAGTGYTLAAGQGAVVSLDSNTFNVTALAPSKVIWAVQPSTANRTSNLIPAPTVRVADTYGNYVAQSGQSITLSLQDNTEGATLSGTLTRNTDATGAAVFSGLTLNVVGDYFLRATPATTYPLVDSNLFNVIQIIPQNTYAVMEMLNGSFFYNSNGNASYPETGITFGTDNIDGTTAYTWKIVATNTDNQNATIRLRVGTNNISSITVPGNTNTPTLFSTTISNASITPDGVWSLGTFKGAGTIYSSKIVVQQTGATRTQAIIPLTSMENSTSATLFTSTTSTTFTQPNEMNFPTYNWDSSKIARVDSLVLYVQSSATAGSSCVALFNKTTNSQIGSEICNANSMTSIVSTPILPGLMPSSGEIEVRMRNSGGGTANLTRASLIVRLVSIEKMIAIQRIAPAAAALTASTNFVEQRASSNISKYGTGSVSEFIRCRAKANTSGAGSFVYKTHGTNVSGTAGATNISASTINYTSQSAYTTLDAGPVVTVNNNNQFLSYTHTSGSFALSHCTIDTEVAY